MGDGKRTREFNATAKRLYMSQRGSTDLFIEVKATFWVSAGLITSVHVTAV
jgi:S-adenosylmethionine:tRNA-ribosyltransferase-isomerase (queuine synthetase)